MLIANFKVSRFSILDSRFELPPPTKFTISTWSPSATLVVSNVFRLMTTRLCSMATRLGSICSCERSSETVTGAGSSKGSPLSVIFTDGSGGYCALRSVRAKFPTGRSACSLTGSRLGSVEIHAAMFLPTGWLAAVENGDLQAPGVDRPERHLHLLGRAHLEVCRVEHAFVGHGNRHPVAGLQVAAAQRVQGCEPVLDVGGDWKFEGLIGLDRELGALRRPVERRRCRALARAFLGVERGPMRQGGIAVHQRIHLVVERVKPRDDRQRPAFRHDVIRRGVARRPLLHDPADGRSGNQKRGPAHIVGQRFTDAERNDRFLGWCCRRLLRRRAPGRRCGRTARRRLRRCRLLPGNADRRRDRQNGRTERNSTHAAILL